MKVKIEDLRQKLAELDRLVLDDVALVDWLVELQLDNDLAGNRFSGFDEALKFAQKGKLTPKKFTLDVNKPALKLVNCQDTPAYLTMKDVLPEATRWVKEQGQVFIGFSHGGYHENLGTIARMFAEQDILCIYSSSGGPQGTVPYGGSKDVLGTNPIAYGIPTSGMPIVFDAATAQYAWGTIGLAKRHGEDLPANTYLDKDGKYTTDPNVATSLIPFGGYKGFAVNLLLEVMTTTLVGGKAGSLQTDETALGGFMLLVDPAALGGLDEFKAQADKLVMDIESNPPAEGFSEVRVPGYHSQQLRQRQLRSGFVEVDEKFYKEFLQEYEKLVTGS